MKNTNGELVETVLYNKRTCGQKLQKGTGYIQQQNSGIHTSC